MDEGNAKTTTTTTSLSTTTTITNKVKKTLNVKAETATTSEIAMAVDKWVTFTARLN